MHELFVIRKIRESMEGKQKKIERGHAYIGVSTPACII